jgi:hypothetical protein
VGYTPKERVYRLRFEDPEYDGLVVEAGSPTIGRLRRLMRLSAGLAGADLDALTPEQAGALDALVEGFAEQLRSWNVDHPRTGEPVPPTVEGIDSLGADFTLPVIETWLETVSGPDAGLKKSSNSGPRSPAVSLPMEPLSGSLLS